MSRPGPTPPIHIEKGQDSKEDPMISRLRWALVGLVGATLLLPGVAWAADTAVKAAGCCFPGCGC